VLLKYVPNLFGIEVGGEWNVFWNVVGTCYILYYTLAESVILSSMINMSIILDRWLTYLPSFPLFCLSTRNMGVSRVKVTIITWAVVCISLLLIVFHPLSPVKSNYGARISDHLYNVQDHSSNSTLGVRHSTLPLTRIDFVIV
jgi:hypothetical protein